LNNAQELGRGSTYGTADSSGGNKKEQRKTESGQIVSARDNKNWYMVLQVCPGQKDTKIDQSVRKATVRDTNGAGTISRNPAKERCRRCKWGLRWYCPLLYRSWNPGHVGILKEYDTGLWIPRMSQSATLPRASTGYGTDPGLIRW